MGILALVFTCALAAEGAQAAGAPRPRSVLRQATIDATTKAIIHKDRSIYLLSEAVAGEGYRDMAHRTTGDKSNARILMECNEDAAPVPAKMYLIPFQVAKPELQREVVKALFPQDRIEQARYVHVVSARTDVSQGESLWNIAFWFTGEGENFPKLMEFNGLERTRLERGQRIVIPPGLLSAAFKPQEPPRIENPEALAFITEKGRPYAVYRLKRGETLYSSVVIRFCGRIDAEEVNGLAADIARLNHIDDVSDIPAGHPIRIPVELLSPEYRQSTDPKRVAYEMNRHAPMRFKRKYHSDNLKDVRIILDSGHGGVDSGAHSGRVCEDEYSYDILCRLKLAVESQTEATVLPLIRDTRTGHRPRKRRLLAADRNETLLTTPAYRLGDARIGVNLRWSLANYHYTRLRKAGVPEGKIVFVSLHADSRHPDVRGTMIYVAGEELVRESASLSKPVYAAHKEVQAVPVAYFPKARRLESEGLSIDLADQIVRQLRKTGLPVHMEKPIRPFVIRKNVAWVPAVLRYNLVPTKILVEVCNMNNPEDVHLLVTADYRQKMAASLLSAIKAYFAPDWEQAARVRSQ